MTAANPTRIETVKSRMTSFARCRGGPLNMLIQLVRAVDRRCFQPVLARSGLYGDQGGCLPILMGHLHET